MLRPRQQCLETCKTPKNRVHQNANNLELLLVSLIRFRKSLNFSVDDFIMPYFSLDPFSLGMIMALINYFITLKWEIHPCMGHDHISLCVRSMLVQTREKKNETSLGSPSVFLKNFVKIKPNNKSCYKLRDSIKSNTQICICEGVSCFHKLRYVQLIRYEMGHFLYSYSATKLYTINHLGPPYPFS